MTCEVWFYHLERTPLERALPDLLEKTLSKGWRALVRATSPERLAQLDEALWTYKDDSFLAHGVAGEPHAPRQPILLTTAAANENQAQALFALDGAEPGDLSGFARCIFLFDGADEAAVALARTRWKALKSGGLAISYWKQNERGGWVKAA